MPVEFILNGGIWGDASCNSPEWDLNDHLEEDDYNAQWSQDDQTFPDDYLKGLAGSTDSPELARTLTYHVYAAACVRYKKRNLQAAARVIKEFAREHPELFIGVVLDSDTYMNPFFKQVEYFDFNPGMIRQFREWLRGSGPYAGKGPPGVPNLSSYRRVPSMTLDEVNRVARRNWTSWDEVEPPRKFPGSLYRPMGPGDVNIWDDRWYEEWQVFRQHVVGLHYDELSQWVHEVGIPKDRIFSAQGFISPDPGNKPIAIRITSRGKNTDTSGVSLEGSIPRYGHLGAVIYGDTAENKTPMEGPHSLFAQFARMDPQWGVVEFNNTNLKLPKILPTYDQGYRSFRDLFNYDARMVSPMAWNGSNGLFADQPDYVAYTSWRNTPAEDAMKDFLVSHADLPRGARLWTFGSARLATDDGWSLAKGSLTPGKGFIDLRFGDAEATLAAPPDQVLRSESLQTLYLGLRELDSLETIEVHARIDPASPWQEIVPVTAAGSLARAAPGLAVPLAWPADWRARAVIAESFRIGAQVPSRDRAGAHRPHCAVSAGQRCYRRADSPLMATARPTLAHLDALTGVRALAALWVFAYHAWLASGAEPVVDSAGRAAGRPDAVVRVRMARARHLLRPVRLPADAAGVDSARAQGRRRRSAPRCGRSSRSARTFLRKRILRVYPAYYGCLTVLMALAATASLPAPAGTAGAAAAPGHVSQRRRRLCLDVERRVLDAAVRVAVLPVLSAAVRPARALRSRGRWPSWACLSSSLRRATSWSPATARCTRSCRSGSTHSCWACARAVSPRARRSRGALAPTRVLCGIAGACCARRSSSSICRPEITTTRSRASSGRCGSPPA